MKTWNEIVATELRSYLRWLRVMENTVPALLPYQSRWYKGKFLDVYTRVGRNHESLENKSFVCISNVSVKAEYRGKGLFSSLLQHLEKHADQLRASYLTVESVGNHRLARKLDTLDFSRFVLVHPDSSPSFYRHLPTW